MSLRGDLRTIHLAEILDFVGRGRQTGTLHLRRRAVRKQLAFQEGKLFSVASNDPREYLGHYLLRRGLVSEEQLFAALQRQETTGRPLGELLVAEGALREDDLVQALCEKAEESCYDVFLWPDGTFHFAADEPPPPYAIHLSLDLVSLILEGGRRADEWQRVRRIIPSSTTVFTAGEEPAVEGLARQVWELAAAGKTFAAIAGALHRSEFEVGSVLCNLVEVGHLAVRGATAVEEDVDRSGAVARLLKDGESALADGRVEDARRAFEAVLVVDPLNRTANRALARSSGPPAKPRRAASELLDAVPELVSGPDAPKPERLEPLEGFILSRINGSWTVRAIVRLCPVAQEHALQCLQDLVARGFVRLR